jgi:hypothetical protein
MEELASSLQKQTAADEGERSHTQEGGDNYAMKPWNFLNKSADEYVHETQCREQYGHSTRYVQGSHDYSDGAEVLHKSRHAPILFRLTGPIA